MSYKKAIVGFPLITFLVSFLFLYLFSAEPVGEGQFIGPAPDSSEYLINCTKGAFWIGALPALLIALWAAKHRFIRTSFAPMVLTSALFTFAYGLVSLFIWYVPVGGESLAQYGQHFLDGQLELLIFYALAMSFYGVFVLPFLLPKTRA